MSEFLKFQISQFLTYINILYIKGKHFSCKIQFHTEKVWFYAKNEKNNFSDFFVKIYTDHLSLSAHFSNLYQKISKLSWSVLWKGFEIKSYQRRTFLKYQKKMLQLKVANLTILKSKLKFVKFATISCNIDNNEIVYIVSF